MFQEINLGILYKLSVGGDQQGGDESWVRIQNRDDKNINQRGRIRKGKEMHQKYITYRAKMKNTGKLLDNRGSNHIDG